MKLFLGRLPGDHGVSVRFGTCRGKRQHGPERKRCFDVGTMFPKNRPWILARETRCGRDEFGSIQDRASTHRENKTKLLFFNNFNGLEAGLIEWIRFNAAKFGHAMTLEDSSYRESMLKGYDEVLSALGGPGCAARAAKLIVELLTKK